MILPAGFPFKSIFDEALWEYGECEGYWYVPKARALNDDNVNICAKILYVIFEDFLDLTWNRNTQDELLSRLIAEGIQNPTSTTGTIASRTALSRITKVLLRTLGLLWVDYDREILITDAGFNVIEAFSNKQNPRPIIETQVAKLQYPNPHSRPASGILPHLFLLQILQGVDYYLTHEEFEIFVNLADSQDDVERIIKYIRHWRDVNDESRNTLLNAFKNISVKGDPAAKRFHRIHLNASYQRSFYCYPSYLNVDSTEKKITCSEPITVDNLIGGRLNDVKVTHFGTEEDWFAYFGDPKQNPSWFTYLIQTIRSEESKAQVDLEIERHKSRLTEQQAIDITRMQIEKAIESSYADHPELLHTLEPGLELSGRQVSTPIGRIDLLCKGRDGRYVVIEIKANEAEDSAFGQILRYMGWIHRNFDGGRDNVRGIILAGHFTDKARFSRIGLLKPDSERFLQLQRHTFAYEEI